MAQNLSSVAEAWTFFMDIVGMCKESLRKLLLRGEFDEYPNDKNMHSTARLAEILRKFSEELQKSCENDSTDKFLVEEIMVLEETKSTTPLSLHSCSVRFMEYQKCPSALLLKFGITLKRW